MKKYLLSMAAMLLLASGAQAASTFVLKSVTYSNTFAPTAVNVANCTGCGVGIAEVAFPQVTNSNSLITLTNISWMFNAGGNNYSIAFDATTNLIGSATLTKTGTPTCVNVVGSVCTATNVISGLGNTSWFTGIGSNGTTACANNRCRVDNYIDANGDLIMLVKRALSESASSTASQLYTLRFTAVPVPAAVWLFGSALGLMGFARRKVA